MDVIRKGLRLGDSESEERSSSQVTRPSRSLEPETTIKTKLLSAWNNVKYGKNAWNTSEMFKPGFSRNSPVWLLGQAYHKKLTSPAGTPSGEAVRTFSESDTGHEAFQRDFQSRIWLTYRRGLTGLGTATSDCGWGCMVRSGQMMVAQALSLHWLGRHWRLGTTSWQEDRLHRAVLQVFSDLPDTQLAPLSLQSLVGERVGDWCGPHTVSHLLATAVRTAAHGAAQGMLDSLVIYVAQDCTVYRQDVEELCISRATEPELGSDFSLLDLPQPGAQDLDIDGETWCLEDQAGPTQAWKSLVILVPLRLGGEAFNPIYNSCLKNLLTLESCIGIIGGKPRHSLYFIGFQDDDLIHLDPHRLQDRVDTLKNDFNTETYHCSSPRKINLRRIDPSCCVGFYLRDRSEFEEWSQVITSLVTPPHIAGLRPEYPLFVVSEGRSADTRSMTDWVTLGSEEASDQDGFRTEEFVFV